MNEADDALRLQLLSTQNERDAALYLLRRARTEMNDMNLPLIAAIDRLLQLAPMMARKKD